MAGDYPSIVPLSAKPSHRFKNLTGTRFGRLLVIGFGGRQAVGIKSRCTFWWAQCDCGKFKKVRASDLSAGKTNSCGCGEAEWRTDFGHQITHGQTRGGKHTMLYGIWSNMIQRCHNPDNPAYDRYGGRGIFVCKDWLDSFEAFAVFVGTPPSRRHSIDRIDNNGNYEPGNVRWATDHEQASNKRNNRMLSYGGVELHESEWARRLGIKQQTISARLTRLGWSVERTLTTPVQC